MTASLTQDQAHIKPLHQYVSLRLVLEGGFLPEELTPRPPLRHQTRGGRHLLFFDSSQATSSERAIVGGVKSKNVDVVVNKDGIGPVIAVSVRGTGNAFRNLTNRMEEIIGDCANLHMMYPGLVYGFLHVIRANRDGQPNIGRNDVCLDPQGNVVKSIARWHTVLSELTGRRMLTNDVMRYEAITLILAETLEQQKGEIVNSFPRPDSPLLLEPFFRTLYSLYDLRFSYKLTTNVAARRVEWYEGSRVFADMISQFGPEFGKVLGYSPRVVEA